MKKIEEYQEQGKGFYPLMLEKDWQVAILNYMDVQSLNAIDKIDIHFQTDEVFILNKGTAILITAEVNDSIVSSWELVKMKAGIIYNIPKNCWHNIAMDHDSSVFIVEKRDTHKGDYEFHYLTEEDKSLLIQKINDVV